MRRPRKLISPSLTGWAPEMQLNSVLLPAPLGPMSAITSPARTVRLMSWFATRPP